MKHSVITVRTFSDSVSLIECIKELLNKKALIETVDTSRIDDLIKSLTGDISFVLEWPYTDAQYRDCYYMYYANKFNDYSRDAVRVHLFAGSLGGIKFYGKEAEKELQDKYRGYFIIRPLASCPLGRSCISPLAMAKRQFFYCWAQDDVYLLGRRLTIRGFPHVAQDATTHTCAESALWTLMSYYGLKYSLYGAMLPSEIIKRLPSSGERRLPSHGLSAAHIASVLMEDGHECVIHRNTNGDNKSDDVLLSLAHIYIESGIPVILTLGNGKEGHAVAAMGHGDAMKDEAEQAALRGQRVWVDVSQLKKEFVLMDDNMPPYHIADENEPTKDYLDSRYKNTTVRTVIAPLHKHMFMDAKQAAELIGFVFEDKKYGLKELGGGEQKWITRLLMTTSRAFKRAIVNDNNMDAAIKKTLVFSNMPKFIWACEIYRAGEAASDVSGECAGVLILDTTENFSVRSPLLPVLFYFLDDKEFLYNEKVFIGYDKTKGFRMNTYRHNLEGGAENARQ